MRFALIDGAKVQFPVHRLCRVLGVSQSGYFAWRGRPTCRRQRDDMVLLAHVRSAFAVSNGTYGSPRMTRELRDSGLRVGRRRVARLMRDNGLQARQKRRFKRTTDSNHAGPVAPNLLDQDFTATAPDKKWGADISYVWTREGWLYLAVVIDLFARRVVGWATGDRLHRDLALAALRKALTMRRPAAGLIHHSDRGSQGRIKWSSQHLDEGVAMGTRKRRSDRAGRGVLRSPGRPGVARREDRRRFWAAIAAGLASEDAARRAGVSPAAGTRWFREAGGMPPAALAPSSKPLCGRYLSFAEREDIALCRAQGHGVREVARRLGRAASTISRELRRNAATRGGGLDYRATAAQWHAERAARRPKPANWRPTRHCRHMCRTGWPA